jgi:transcription elongation factor Elf1
MKDNYCFVIFCPPLSIFPIAPKDQPRCTEINCPHCNKHMWISEKKRAIKDSCKKDGKDILLACYVCFAKLVIDNPELRDHVRVDI